MKKKFIRRNKSGRLTKKVRQTAEFKNFQYQLNFALAENKLNWFAQICLKYFPKTYLEQYISRKYKIRICNAMDIDVKYFDLMSKYL